MSWSSKKKLHRCYDSVLAGMKLMYNSCRLVHCDLSEYNLLYHENEPWFIDVGQVRGLWPIISVISVVSFVSLVSVVSLSQLSS